MALSRDLLKKWSDFSDSETKPLSWMLFGPLLVILTTIVAMPHVLTPYLPFVTAMGFVLSWRFQIRGFLLTLALFILYFVLDYLFGDQSLFLWKVGSGISFALGLTITFLSMEELKSYYTKEKEKKESALEKLQLSLRLFEEKGVSDKRVLSNEIDALQGKLSASKEEVEALLGLVDASGIEADKFEKQNRMLLAHSIEVERDLEGVKQKLNEANEELLSLRAQNQEFSNAAQKRLNQLNTLRVDLYQSHLMNESYQKQIAKARAYFKTKQKDKEKTSLQKTFSRPKTDEGRPILKALEKDKGIIKKTYDETLREYQELKTALDAGHQKLKKLPSKELSIEMNRLDSETKQKKQRLEQTKAELIGIEREIFIIKKGLQETGAFVH